MAVTETGAYGTATYSDDGLYRYTLDVPLRHDRAYQGPHLVVFVMLNPSTATHEYPDPTLRRCATFAAWHGAARMRVLNAYAWRSTDPAALRHKGPAAVGDDNDDAFLLTENEAARHGLDTVWIAAWGTHVDDGDPDRTGQLRDLIAKTGTRQVWRLGTPTKDGHPRHPLYLPSATQIAVHWSERDLDG